MAVGGAGIFRDRLRALVVYSGVIQFGYAALAVSAGLLRGEQAAFEAAVFQVIAAGAALALMWIAASALATVADAQALPPESPLPAQDGNLRQRAQTSQPWGRDALPLSADTPQPAWAVFSFALACMSLAGLPPVAGLPAKVAIIHAGLREPGVLFIVTLGAAALGVVSLWVYAGVVLPLITGRISAQPAAVSVRMRVEVDVLVAALLALGLIPYIGFAIGAVLTGGRYPP
jgi:formate hydrogenlyase subunit 3/multisubunit Na+/H+ antiporter MnhD subunit